MKPTKEQIEKYRKIVADAPKDATHFDECEGFITYLTSNGQCWHEGGDTYIKINEYIDIQSLENLRTIITLWDDNQRLAKEVGVLKQINMAIEVDNNQLRGFYD